MDVSKSNSLIELYFSKYKEVNNSETFLQWLKPENAKEYLWQDVTEKILIKYFLCFNFLFFLNNFYHKYSKDNCNN